MPEKINFDAALKDLQVLLKNSDGSLAQIKKMKKLAAVLKKSKGDSLTDIKKIQSKIDTNTERYRGTIHDLKVPITISLLNLELLEMEEDPEESQQLITGIRREMEFLLDTIGNVLELEQDSEGKLEINMEKVSIQELIDIVIKRMNVIVRDKPQLILRRELPGDFPSILCSRHKMIRVLDNLFSNAIKYTEIGAVTVSGESMDGYAYILFSDTGCGIEKERLPELFNFFNGDSDKLESTGVGLAYVRSVILAMGGKIEIDSIKGVGTTITLILQLS